MDAMRGVRGNNEFNSPMEVGFVCNNFEKLRGSRKGRGGTKRGPGDCGDNFGHIVPVKKSMKQKERTLLKKAKKKRQRVWGAGKFGENSEVKVEERRGSSQKTPHKKRPTLEPQIL